MSWTSFFSSMEQGAWAGLSWLYNNTIGGFTSFVGSAVLSGAESFAAAVMSAFLAVFGGVLNWIASAISGALILHCIISKFNGSFRPFTRHPVADIQK